MRTIDKADAQKIHAKRRAEERYGIRLNGQQYRELIARIQAKDGEFIFRESNRLTHWGLVVQGIRVRVVYDSLRKTIVTFLPREDRIDWSKPAIRIGAG